MIDAVVAGGGPAGLAAAIGLARAGREVVVVEPREGIIDKACGEGLMPPALDHLAALGVDAPGLAFRGIRYQHAVDPDDYAEADLPRPGRAVRRTALHRALRDCAAALGVRWLPARVEDITQDDTHAIAMTSAGPLTARHVIAADGLHSPIRRHLGLDRPVPSPRYGMRAHYACAPWSDRVEVHWTADAEAYISPVAPGEIGVALLFDRPARYAELLASFPLLAARLTGAEATSRPRGAGPFRQRAASPRRGRVLLIGDAAGYVDPLTGEGITLALATAAAAVRCVVTDDLAAYPRAWRRATRACRWLTRGLLALARFTPTRRLIVPGARRLPGVFPLALAVLAGGAPASPADGRASPLETA